MDEEGEGAQEMPAKSEEVIEELPPPHPLMMLASPQPQPQPATWHYKTGAQFPAEEKTPRKGSVLAATLERFPMIEILSVEKKGRTYGAYCHTCDSSYSRISARSLSDHVFSSMHERRSLVPADAANVDRKEHARRQLILSNKKFADFIVLHEDQTLSCKYCNVELQFLNDKLSAHRHTLKHKMAAGQRSIDLTEGERLAKIQALMRQFPDVVGMVTDMDVHVNEEYFEHYKAREQITLQLNDIFCKICRRKFVRTDPNGYRDAIRDHLKTKQHKRALESLQAQADGDGDGSKVKPAKLPPKKISTYRHDPEDLKEAARALIQAKMTPSQCDRSSGRVIQAVVRRQISSSSIVKGLQLLGADYPRNKSSAKKKKKTHIKPKSSPPPPPPAPTTSWQIVQQ
ncbi:hypothetical protein TYRP_019197 [Tyrophagus putrescentiae]|nr:hypothetical protein TYRP_019197 [Tyrophagus putrescentiae]